MSSQVNTVIGRLYPKFFGHDEGMTNDAGCLMLDACCLLLLSIINIVARQNVAACCLMLGACGPKPSSILTAL